MSKFFEDKLKYTSPNKNWTTAQRVFYEKNGYIVIPRLIPQDIIDKCHERYDAILEGKVSQDGVMIMHDIKDRKSVNKIQDINRDPVFREYIEHPKILDIIEAVTGPNIMAVHSMLIAKPPDIGFGTSKHPPHQDLLYFPFRPANKIVASWTAMEPCFRENGCLYVSPGSHTCDRVYKHEYPPGLVNKFYYGIQDLPEDTKWIDLEMDPGDTVFFHPLLIHGSGVNVSNRTRRAISCHYAASECHYVDVTNSPQNRVSEDVLKYAQKQYPGIEMKYQDLWCFKSTLVRGVKSSL